MRRAATNTGSGTGRDTLLRLGRAVKAAKLAMSGDITLTIKNLDRRVVSLVKPPGPTWRTTMPALSTSPGTSTIPASNNLIHTQICKYGYIQDLWLIWVVAVGANVVQADLMALPKDFQKHLTTIQMNLKSAYARLQTSIKESVNPGGHVPIDYFLAQTVLHILKQSSERAVFWGYTGDTGIWEKLVLAYERKGVLSFTHPSPVGSCMDSTDPLGKTVQAFGQQKQHSKLCGAQNTNCPI